MRTFPSRTAAVVARVRHRDLSELPVLFEKWMPGLSRLKGVRRRLFFPVRVFWLFLLQVMRGNLSCHESLQNLLAHLFYEEGKTASSNTSGYCQARKRLKGKCVESLDGEIVSAIESQSTGRGLWQGRTVKIVDGSSVSMPDTKPNQKRYPQPRTQKKGCGFPVLRLVALFSLATGTILAVAHDALRVAERTLFRRLWKHFQPGDVALGDCGFTSYADFHLLKQQGVDSVMRNHPRRSVGVRKIKRLGRGDWLVAWRKTSVRPTWLSRKTWEDLPNEMIVRQLSLCVDISGFRTRHIVIVTTLLDPKAFPKRAFADLYRRRWLAELFLRDIKISLGMDVLKCKTPDMIRKELLMYLIAYNLIRALMLEGAAQYHTDPLRISFKETAHTLRQWTPLLPIAAQISPEQLDSITHALLHYVAINLVPHRPNRLEPRAKKRRPKNYQLLNKPRSQFQEIRHRNKYRAGLS